MEVKSLASNMKLEIIRLCKASKKAIWINFFNVIYDAEEQRENITIV
jgi:hypothetical protein